MSEDKKLKLTTATGCSIFDNQNSIAAGSRGPLLMQDVQLLEQMQQFNRSGFQNESFMPKVLVRMGR